MNAKDILWGIAAIGLCLSFALNSMGDESAAPALSCGLAVRRILLHRDRLRLWDFTGREYRQVCGIH